MKIKLLKFKSRLLVAYRILFRKYDHWLIINVDKDNLIKLLKDEDFETDGYYHGIQPYVYFKMVERVASSKDEIDMMLEKAKFEAEASLLTKK